MHSNQGVVHLFGSNVAALVFAEVVSRKQRVLWHKGESPLFSGHFAGIKGDSGLTYDIGMNAVEGTPIIQDGSRPLGDRTTLGRYEAQASADQVKNWLSEFCNLEPFTVSTRDTTDSPLYPDFVLSDDFSLGLLRTYLASDAAAKTECPHPSKKYLEPELFRGYKIREYYRRIYGEQTGDAILRFSSRYFGESLEDLPVPLHRFAWAPLPWPEYLLAVRNQEASGLEHRKEFLSTGNRPISEILGGVLNDLVAKRANLSVVSANTNFTRLNATEEIHFLDKKDSTAPFGLSKNIIHLQFWFTDKPVLSHITSYLNLSDKENQFVLRWTSWGNPSSFNDENVWQIVTESTVPLTASQLEEMQGVDGRVILDKSVAYSPKIPQHSWFDTLTRENSVTIGETPRKVVFEPLSSSLNEQIFRGLEEAKRF